MLLVVYTRHVVILGLMSARNSNLLIISTPSM